MRGCTSRYKKYVENKAIRDCIIRMYEGYDKDYHRDFIRITVKPNTVRCCLTGNYTNRITVLLYTCSTIKDINDWLNNCYEVVKHE